MHFNPVHRFVLTESKMETRAIVALVSAPAVDFVDQLQVTRHNFDQGADRVATGGLALQADLDPMVIVWWIVAQEGWFTT